jgi:glutathione synthase/RimK-type ligase-like ATP-grasp enzyme
MKLAIHEQQDSFSDRWISYCDTNKIPFKLVNCYDSRIIYDLKNVDALLWHWTHFETKGQLVAKQIIAAVESLGITVFPNINTCWHYDDKIAQKYLLEAIDAPIVPSHIFFSKTEATLFIERANYPLVFKLRCGAGSQNVRLVKTKKDAKRLCNKAFSKGFIAAEGYFTDAITKLRKVKNVFNLFDKMKRLPISIMNTMTDRNLFALQKGYLYFQDFLPDNSFDTRITIIGDRAFGFQRNVRPGDFRASGSGHILYDNDKIDMRCVEISFNVSKQLKTQSLCFDYIFDDKNDPKICEISYCFQSKAVYNCTGYWDSKLNWVDKKMWPEDAILLDLIEKLLCNDEPIIPKKVCYKQVMK